MISQQLQLLALPAHRTDEARERGRRLQGVLTQLSLRDEKALFETTRSVEHGTCGEGFTPGFLNTATGAVVPSRFADGSPAPLHVIDGLPESWIAERTASGDVARIRSEILSGYLRDGRFYTREQASLALAH